MNKRHHQRTANFPVEKTRATQRPRKRMYRVAKKFTCHWAHGAEHALHRAHHELANEARAHQDLSLFPRSCASSNKSRAQLPSYIRTAHSKHSSLHSLFLREEKDRGTIAHLRSAGLRFSILKSSGFRDTAVPVCSASIFGFPLVLLGKVAGVPMSRLNRTRACGLSEMYDIKSFWVLNWQMNRRQ